jgi:hypothetical protein
MKLYNNNSLKIFLKMEESANTFVEKSGNTENSVSISTINHELNQYDYVEGIAFDGLVPKMMDAKGVKTTGKWGNSVSLFGVDDKGIGVKGSDALEVVDFQGFFDDEEGGKQ